MGISANGVQHRYCIPHNIFQFAVHDVLREHPFYVVLLRWVEVSVESVLVALWVGELVQWVLVALWVGQFESGWAFEPVERLGHALEKGKVRMISVLLLL